jgi:hypothetical protein
LLTFKSTMKTFEFRNEILHWFREHFELEQKKSHLDDLPKITKIQSLILLK